jgi:hypothetical protein
MVTKKNNIIIAATVAVFSIFMVVVSCSKTNKDMTVCKNVVCRNGGHCNDSSKCVCPVGFEDTVCGTSTVGKYIGNWGADQKIEWSDSSQFIGQDTAYTAALTRTATPTTFFISNFNNNAYYNDVLCTLDSINSYHFTIDTISPFQAIYFNYQILKGAGNLNKTKDTITAWFLTRHRSPTTNWEVDSVTLRLVKHNY